jgi:leucyl/phenylalanyl-tRNA--protein transferase
MFSRRSDASKVALVYLVRQLAQWDFTIIDCQMPSAHLFSLGAEQISRREFSRILVKACDEPDRPGPWHLDPELVVN